MLGWQDATPHLVGNHNICSIFTFQNGEILQMVSAVKLQCFVSQPSFKNENIPSVARNVARKYMQVK